MKLETIGHFEACQNWQPFRMCPEISRAFQFNNSNFGQQLRAMFVQNIYA